MANTDALGLGVDAGVTAQPAPTQPTPADSTVTDSTPSGESPKTQRVTREVQGPKVDAGDSGARVGEYDPTATNAAVQAQVDAENEVGFRGFNPDPTPNENYTVAGVTSGAPTPETHAAEMRPKVQARLDEFAGLAMGTGENTAEAVARGNPAR